MTGLERSLYKLNAVRELGEWATEFIDLDAEEDDGNDGNGIFFTAEDNKNQSAASVPESRESSSTSVSGAGENNSADDNDGKDNAYNGFGSDIDGNANNDEDTDSFEDQEAIPTFFAQPCVTPVPNSAVEKRQDSVIVIIRHGKTQVRDDAF